MNVLVAGGAGFIGSHLIDRLIEDGHNVVCADKLIMGNANISHLKKKCYENQFVFYETDLSIQKNVDTLFSDYDFDFVYHLAANSDIQKGGKAPEIDYNNTLLTTRFLLEGMRKSNVKRLFFASTSAVYGEMLDIELSEETGGLKPVSYYGGAKLASEALISSYSSMCDISAVVFRFPNVIGPRLTHGVIYDFIKKLQNNPMELEILGDGTQCKPYIYVHDLLEAIFAITKVMPSGMEVYNLSCEGEGTSVTEIANIVVEEMGLRDVAFRYTGGNRGWKGDVPRFKYNISKILSTGWKPCYSSCDAVRQSVKDALSNKDN